MSKSPESFSNNLTGSENYEQEPQQRYKVHIEEWEDFDTQKRAKFLEMASGEGTKNLAPNEAEAYQQEFQTIIQKWKQELSEHVFAIHNLERTGSIRDLMGEAWKSRNEAGIQDVRELCKGILKTYGGQWEEMSEERKRMVRMAEMAVFMTDAVRMGIDIEKGQENTESFRRTAEKMGRYNKSVDIPRTFKEEFLMPAAQKIGFSRESKRNQPEAKRTQQAPAQPNPNLTPWENGNVHELWGNNDSKAARQSSPGPTATQQNKEEYSQIPDEITIKKPPRLPGEVTQNPSADDTIDLTYNPKTGSFDPEKGAGSNSNPVTGPDSDFPAGSGAVGTPPPLPPAPSGE